MIKLRAGDGWGVSGCRGEAGEDKREKNQDGEKLRWENRWDIKKYTETSRLKKNLELENSMEVP